MSLWSADASKAPNWAPCVRTARGWEHAETGEVLVAFADTSFTVPATATITKVSLGRTKKKYKTGETIKLLVEFNQNVKVTVGANGAPYIPVSLNGTNVNFVYVDPTSVDQAGLLFEYTVKPTDVAAATQVVAGNVAVKASKALLTGNAGLTYTAKTAGTAGNSITVAYVVSGNNTPLTVGVVGDAITVNVATGAGGAATSTATLIKAAIEGSGPATALVDVALVGDGTGVVSAVTATNLTGGLAAVAGTAIILPSLTTITDFDGSPTNATLTFGAAAPDLTAVTVN